MGCNQSKQVEHVFALGAPPSPEVVQFVELPTEAPSPANRDYSKAITLNRRSSREVARGHVTISKGGVKDTSESVSPIQTPLTWTEEDWIGFHHVLPIPCK